MNTLMKPQEYEDMFESEDKLWWYVGLRDILYFFVKKYSFKDAKILDAGSGTGKNIEFFLSKGYSNISGIEYSEEALKYCKKRNLSNVEQGSLTELKYDSNSFDVVYCMDVIYIFEDEDRKKAIAEMYRVLKPGGLFIFNSAAFEFLRSQHDDLINTKKRFTKKNHEGEFKNFDLEIIKSSYRVTLLFPLVLAFKISKQLFRSDDIESKSDQGVFPFGINWVLTKIQLLENWFFRKINFPVGSSLFFVARKKS